MFEMLPDTPENVLAFKAVGEITADDYKKLEPMVEEMITKHKKMRVAFVLGPEWKGYQASAAWEDAKFGLEKLTKWERCAVVTDRDWVEHLTKAFGWMIPGKVKVFDLPQLQDAIAWAGADD